MAASLLKAILRFSLPYPHTDLEYASSDQLPSVGGGGAFLFPGIDLFADPFRCSPTHLLSTLCCCCEELVTRGYAKKVVPFDL